MEAQRKHMVILWGKKTFVSGNVGDKKNTHWGGQIFIFFNQFSRGILFSSLVSLFLSFAFVFACFFFEIKNIYADTHSTMQVGEW